MTVENISTETLFLADRALADAPVPFQRVQPTTLACGLNSGEYFPFGFGPGELPDDQQADDALSTCFDGDVSRVTRDIVGAPVVHLRLASDQAKAQVVVRLCDLRPDGSSGLISLGLLNLRQRDDREFPADLTPGEFYNVAVVLDQIAYRLPEGHRLRVAVSASYWPFAWPEAEVFNLTPQAGSLALPVRVASGDAAEWVFPEAEAAPALAMEVLRGGDESKVVSVDADTGEISVLITGDTGLVRDYETGLVTGSKVSECWRVGRDDPGSARADISWERFMGRDDWGVRTEVCSRMWREREGFCIEQRLRAWEGDELVFDKVFSTSA